MSVVAEHLPERLHRFWKDRDFLEVLDAAIVWNVPPTVIVPDELVADEAAPIVTTGLEGDEDGVTLRLLLRSYDG